MREVCRQPFQRPGPSYQKKKKKKKLHFKNFKKKKNHFWKKLFSDHVWTWSFIRDVHRQPFQRSSPSYPKRKNFVSKFSKKKKIFSKKFSLNYIWTWSFMREVCRQPFQSPVTITQKTFFQRLKIKTFLCVNLG